MGNIVWTKTYSASDNGSILTGSNIQDIQNDITTIINGNLTNVNVASAAAIVESKISFNTSTGHYHDGVGSRAISTGGFRGFVQGAELEYVAADQIKVQSGALDIAGTMYTRTSYSTTIDTDTAGHWVEGASQRAVSTWAYVYAYNDSGSTYDVKYWLQAPQYANTGADDSSVKIFRQSGSVWYRCLGAVRMDSVGSGNILNFYQRNNIVMYDVPVSITTSTSVGAWSSATSCSAAIPAISTLGIFNGVVNGTGAPVGLWIRPNGGTWSTDDENAMLYYDAANNTLGGGQVICATDSSQQIQYYTAALGSLTNIDCEGYILSIR